MQPLLQAETGYDGRVTAQPYYDSMANQMGAPIDKHSSHKSEACLCTHTHAHTRSHTHFCILPPLPMGVMGAPVHFLRGVEVGEE